MIISNYKHGNDIYEHVNWKTNEPHMCPNLISSYKHAFVKNTRQHYKHNKFKIICPTWNDVFELLDGSYSVSDIQDYVEYIINITHQSSYLYLHQQDY